MPVVEEFVGHAVELGLHSVDRNFRHRSVNILLAFYKNNVAAPCAR